MHIPCVPYQGIRNSSSSSLFKSKLLLACARNVLVRSATSNYTMASNTPSQADYSFPTSRLVLTQTDPSRTPIVLVACGSFSPIVSFALDSIPMVTANPFRRIFIFACSKWRYLRNLVLSNMPMLISNSQADFAKFNKEFEVMGGYLSPVGDAYKKAGLVSSTHRFLLILPSFQLQLICLEYVCAN